MDIKCSIVGDRNTLIVNDPKTIDALLRIIERQQSEIARLTKLVFELQTKQGKKREKQRSFGNREKCSFSPGGVGSWPALFLC